MNRDEMNTIVNNAMFSEPERLAGKRVEVEAVKVDEFFSYFFVPGGLRSRGSVDRVEFALRSRNLLKGGTRVELNGRIKVRN